jgi:hypothetical protein
MLNPVGWENLNWRDLGAARSRAKNISVSGWLAMNAVTRSPPHITDVDPVAAASVTCVEEYR